MKAGHQHCFLLNAVARRAGGGLTGGLNVCRHLPIVAPEDAFVVLASPGLGYEDCAAPNVQVLTFDWPAYGPFKQLRFLNRVVPVLCNQHKASALFSMGNFATLRAPTPQLVLFHKAHFVWDGPLQQILPAFRDRLRHRLERLYFRYAIRPCTVAVQTEAMRQSLIHLYGLGPEQVHVVPNAPNQAVEPDAVPGELALKMAALRRPLRLFYLAVYYPHKNVEILEQVVARLEALGIEDFAVVTTIAPEHGVRAARFLARMHRHAAPPNPRFLNLGPVPLQQVPHCFAQSWACLMPTLLESFSGTYLEAMSAGCPILTSDRDFAREVCGDAALYFDPLDAESIVQAILRLRDEPGLREQLIEAGRRRLQQHLPSWAEVTARYVELLRQIAAAPASF